MLLVCVSSYPAAEAGAARELRPPAGSWLVSLDWAWELGSSEAPDCLGGLSNTLSCPQTYGEQAVASVVLWQCCVKKPGQGLKPLRCQALSVLHVLPGH